MSRTKHILSYAIPIVILLFFLFGSFFAPHDPTATNIRDKYLPSSAEYPFGTDDFGRCEFSRILEGGKTTLGIVLVGSAIVILLGILFGILPGCGSCLNCSSIPILTRCWMFLSLTRWISCSICKVA